MKLDPLSEKFFELQRESAPDSRLRHSYRTEYGTLGLMEPVFCASCTKRQGSVTADREMFQYFMILCDDCFTRYGGLPLPEILEPMRNGIFFPEQT